MIGVEKTGDFLPGVENMGLSVIGDKKILSVRYKGETITKTFEFSDDDTWVSLEIDGTEYDVNIWETDPKVWNASIHGLEEVEDGEGGTREQIDTNVFVAIYQEVHPESFSIVEKCHISGKDIVFESKEGEEIREYDVCPTCEEHTHPDEMVAMDDDHEHLEICSNCNTGSIEDCENKDNLVNAVIDQIKEDMESGDTTVLGSILEQIPMKDLVQMLPEEQWGDFT